MSYILEALRRAERERQMSKVPTVESLAQTPPSQQSRVPLRIWLLGGATVSIALAALLVVLLRQPASAPAAPPASVAEPESAPAPAPAAPAPKPIPRAAPTGIEDDGELQSLDDLAGDERSSTVAAAKNDDEPRPVAAPRETLITPRQPVVREPEPYVAPEPMTSVAPEPVSVPPPAPTIAVPSGATLLREMPDAYRAQFPVRTLDVHVYDPDPARRWIMVSGKRYGEGQLLDSGPRVAEIVDSGVIFDFQNARVLLPVR